MNKPKDITGQRFGKLVAKQIAAKADEGALWECICDCGNQVITLGPVLRMGQKKSCGCLSRLKDLSGLRFGRWVVLTRSSPSVHNKHHTYWLCKCDRGTEKPVLADQLSRATKNKK